MKIVNKLTLFQDNCKKVKILHKLLAHRLWDSSLWQWGMKVFGSVPAICDNYNKNASSLRKILRFNTFWKRKTKKNFNGFILTLFWVVAVSMNSMPAIAGPNIPTQLTVCFCNRTDVPVAVQGNFLWLPGQQKWRFIDDVLESGRCNSQVLVNNSQALELLYLKIGHAALSNQIYERDVTFNYFVMDGRFVIFVEPGLSPGCYTHNYLQNFSITLPRNF